KVSSPCKLTISTTTRANAAVVQENIAGRPPAKAMDIVIINGVKRPVIGSSPATIEKETASGINAILTINPAIIFVKILGFLNHSSAFVNVFKSSPAFIRSEERRVGKECSTRWWWYHCIEEGERWLV